MSKKKKIWIIIGISALVVALALVFFIKQKNSDMVDGSTEDDMPVLVEKVTEEELDESILVTGTIVPEDEQKIYADVEQGEIKEFNVKENGKVKKGDILFTYDSAPLDREFEAAVRSRDMVQNSVASFQHQINQMNNDIATMKKAQNNPPEEGEEGVFVTKDEIKQMELEKNQLVLELENTKAEVAAAQGEINAVDEQRKALTVKSKLDGTVVKLNKNQERTEEGASEPVIHIVSSKPFKVIGTMSEFDAVKIKKDQPVAIIPKVYKDREWQGEVESVSQHPTDEGMGDMDMYGMGDSNVTMYPFTVNITDDTSELRQGFHVSLEVSIGADEKKIVVPHSAVLDDMMMGFDEDEDMNMMDEVFGTGGFDEMDDTSFVYILVDGVLERRDIETGKMNDEFIEVISGVELDELVVVTPDMDMFDGMEVTSYDEVE